MDLLDRHVITRDGAHSEIQLLVGDVTAIPDEHSVDLLVVSAFPDDYLETPTSVIGALASHGISVGALAKNKESHLRALNCWVSRPLDRPDFNVRQLLSFEPKRRLRTLATDQGADDGHSMQAAVDDLFRALIPFVTGPPWISSVAMPLLAAGDQGEDPLEMLRALMNSATHWLAAGLPLQMLKIVVYEGSKTTDPHAASAAFRSLAEKSAPASITSTSDYAHDLFVSYSRRDERVVDSLVAQIRSYEPNLNIYIDREKLRTGSFWQREIFEALERSRQVLCLYSPDYLKSDVCQDEYQLALLHHRKGGTLIPAYLRSTRLPLHMQLVQYHDCREEDQPRLAALAREIANPTAAQRARGAPPRPAPSRASPPVLHQTVSAAGLDIDISVRIRPGGLRSLN